MKQNRFKILCGVMLGLALLAAIPFTASAQAEVKPDAVQKVAEEFAGPKAETKEFAENKEITLTIEGRIAGGTFVFEENTIRYINTTLSPRPKDITIDGKPWEDLSKPFELDYTPDFAKAGILEKSGTKFYFVDATQKQFSLRIDNSIPGGGAVHRNVRVRLHVKLAMKNQLPHDDLPEYQPVPAKSISMDENPDEPTDGKDQSTSRPVSAPIQDTYQPQSTKIDLVAAVDKLAGFRIQANSILYQNYKTRVAEASGPGILYRGGKYASGVTVNGKQWTNLNRPFEMHITPDPTRLKKFSSDSDRCKISYSLHHGVLEIIIENPDEAPAQVHIQLTFD